MCGSAASVVSRGFGCALHTLSWAGLMIRCGPAAGACSGFVEVDAFSFRVVETGTCLPVTCCRAASQCRGMRMLIMASTTMHASEGFDDALAQALMVMFCGVQCTLQSVCVFAATVQAAQIALPASTYAQCDATETCMLCITLISHHTSSPLSQPQSFLQLAC